MTELEGSLRKLVREEASSAALGTIETIHTEVRDGMRGIRGDLHSIAAQEFKASTERLTAWSRMCLANPVGSAERPAQIRNDENLAQWREKALLLALEHYGADDKTLDYAAKFARFLIDGCLDGNARPLPELPSEEQDAGEVA